MHERTSYEVSGTASMPDLRRLDGPIFYLNSNSDRPSYIAVGSLSTLSIEPGGTDPLGQLQAFLDERKDWIFGFLTYDLKNSIEDLYSENPDGVEVPLLHFVQPEYVVELHGKVAKVHGWSEPSEALISALQTPAQEHETPAIHLQPRIDRATYLKRVNHLLDHIQKGDIYEINFCHEFFSTEELPDPYNAYLHLNRHTEAPFSSYLRFGKHAALCASPERYLKKEGTRVMSQPIKGTIRRGKDPAEDERLKEALANDPKEQGENVMIVDLVRNDLSRFAKKGSVKVDELFGVYPFPTLFQMISTVSCEVEENLSFTQMIRDTFPMGSMTGAPKVSAMQLSEKYECSRRGLYSGAIGYIRPDGDFDFNVVIRTILYDSEKPYISVHVGGAITALCKPEQEYEESLLKAEALLKSLRSDP